MKILISLLLFLDFGAVCRYKASGTMTGTGNMTMTGTGGSGNGTVGGMTDTTQGTITGTEGTGNETRGGQTRSTHTCNYDGHIYQKGETWTKGCYMCECTFRGSLCKDGCKPWK